jgi:hypothetical protein
MIHLGLLEYVVPQLHEGETMRTHRILRALLVFAWTLVFPIRSYAAAQLAAGAKTSAQPTSTNPQQRQLQLTFDPGDGHDHVTSFELTVQFDPATMYIASLADIQLVDPYNGFGNGNGGNALPPPIIDNQDGLIMHIQGSAPIDKTQGGDVNIFSINFHLKDGVSLSDTPLFFQINAKGDHDYIGFTDPDNPSGPEVKVTGDGLAVNGAIEATTLVGTFNQLAAEVSPVPQAFWAGLALGGLIVLRKGLARLRAAD